MLIIIVIFCFILVVAHRHRLVVLRRICLLMGLLYLMRAATIYITVLPVPDPVNMTCLPSLNSTAFKVVAARAFNFMLTGGLTLGNIQNPFDQLSLSPLTCDDLTRHGWNSFETEGGGYLCGDYFFSGHTVILTMGALVIQVSKALPLSCCWIVESYWKINNCFARNTHQSAGYGCIASHGCTLSPACSSFSWLTVTIQLTFYWLITSQRTYFVRITRLPTLKKASDVLLWNTTSGSQCYVISSRK